MSKGSRIFSIVGIIGGLLSLIFGFVVLGMDTGSFESSKGYGGDAYTGIQNAAAQTANNVQDLAEIIATGMAFVLIVFGITMISYFFIQFFKSFAVQSKVINKPAESAGESAAQAKVDMERIRKIENLRAQGLITEEEYRLALSKK